MNAFHDAVMAHRRADIAMAERLYREILTTTPDHADALHHLGLLCHQSGRHAQAVEFMERAAVIRPADAVLQINLGTASKAAGRLDKAIARLRRAVSLAPRMAAAHFNLGNAWLAAGHPAEAEAAFEAAARLQPDDVGAIANRANALLLLHRYREASEASARAVALAPQQASLHVMLGQALHGMERCVSALDAFRTAIALAPALVAARVGAGTTLCALEDYGSAVEQLRAALDIDPACAPAWFNLGCAHLALGSYAAAEAAFSRTLQLEPDLPAAHLNRALTWLSAGDFARGLPEYEWRLKTVRQTAATPWPRWAGEPLHQKCLLVDAEQGLGDTIHYLRFVPLALHLAPHTVLRVQTALLPLLKPLEHAWGITIIGLPDLPPDVDAHCPLLSLPWILGTTPDAMPATPAAIPAPEGYRAKWRASLTPLKRRRVGLAWSGRIRPYENRAMPVEALAPLFALDNVDWIVLQREISASERTFLAAGPHADRVHCFADRIDDLADTAAIIETLDAVVTIDTSIAHLAGAMRKPLWLMLSTAPDWRWRLDDASSRWYPTSRLVRQTRAGRWSDVVARVAQDLRAADLW